MDELDPQPDKYVFLENNSEDDTLTILTEWRKKHSAEIIRLWFREDAVQILGQKYGIIGLVRQMLLDRARKLDVDYAVFVDDDIYIQYSDFITRITAWKKHLVGVPYPVLTGDHGLRLSPVWHNLGPNRRKLPRKVKTVCHEFEEVFAIGGGIMCISRKLLMDTRVNFLPLSFGKPKPFAEDIGYCHVAKKHGYKTYVDGSMLVGHYVETIPQKMWQKEAWLGNSDFEYGKKPRRKGVVLMPENYIALLMQIDKQMSRNVM